MQTVPHFEQLLAATHSHVLAQQRSPSGGIIEGARPVHDALLVSCGAHKLVDCILLPLCGSVAGANLTAVFSEAAELGSRARYCSCTWWRLFFACTGCGFFIPAASATCTCTTSPSSSSSGGLSTLLA
jgi:hypothetical protein